MRYFQSLLFIGLMVGTIPIVTAATPPTNVQASQGTEPTTISIQGLSFRA